MKDEPAIPVIIDTREQMPFSFSGFPVEIEEATLDAGDYSCAPFHRRISIERKGFQDLVNCLGKGRERFEKELLRLRAYDFAAVVVEGPLSDLLQGCYRGVLEPQAAFQSVLAFEQRYGVAFHFFDNRELAEAATYGLLRHFWRDRQKELYVVRQYYGSDTETAETALLARTQCAGAR